MTNFRNRSHFSTKSARSDPGNMSLRTIMIFPKLNDMHIIDGIRDRFDPLARLVRPHITLVFPFEHDMSNEELGQLLDERPSDVVPFDLVMQGFNKQAEDFGNYLYLDVATGKDVINKIHDILYANELKVCDEGFIYDPHMTVGKFESALLLDEAYEEVKGIDNVFSCRVDTISVEVIGPNEESIIVIEKKLG